MDDSHVFSAPYEFDTDGHRYILLFGDLETVSSKRHPSPIAEIGVRAIVLEEKDNELLAAVGVKTTFHSLVKPSSTCEWSERATDVNKLTKAKVADASPIAIVLAQLVDWLVDMRTRLQKAITKKKQQAEVLFCFAGHNIAGCDLDFLFHAFLDSHIEFPPPIVCYWDTYAAIRMKKQHNWQNGNKTAKDPSVTGDKAAGPYACSTLYQQATNKPLPANIHSVMPDIDMNIAFATHPTFFPCIRQKGAGAKLLDELFKRKAAKFETDTSPGKPDSRVWWEVQDGHDDPSKTYTGAKWGPAQGPNCVPGNPNITSLTELFLHFLPVSYLEQVVGYSIYYATVELVRPIYSTSGKHRIVRFEKWKEGHDASEQRTRIPQEEWQGMSVSSILVFIANLYRMGIYNFDNMDDAWSEDLNLRSPDIADSMTKIAFNQHLHTLHFAPTDDSSTTPATGPLRKIQSLLDTLLRTFAQGWSPGMNLVIDESCIAYKGHLKMRQYNPKKPAKHHIKVFILCCAETGYCLSFEIYTGKEHYVYDRKLGLASDLLINKLLPRLPDGVMHNGHVLYADNWYTTLAFIRLLASRASIRVVGTTRPGPATALSKKPDEAPPINKFPFHPPKDGEHMQRGDMHLVEAREPLKAGNEKEFRLLAALYKDSKFVSMMASAHAKRLDPADTVSRRVTGCRERVNQPSPLLLQFYSRLFGGVDMMDQLLKTFEIELHVMRWYMRVFARLLGMVSHNMWQIAQNHINSPGINYYSQFASAGASKRPDRTLFQTTLAQDLQLYAERQVVADGDLNRVWQPERFRTMNLQESHAKLARQTYTLYDIVVKAGE